MVYVTHIRMSGGAEVQHITHLRWAQPSTGRSNTLPCAKMVEHIREGNDVWVRHNGRHARVVVVDASPPYLRTMADGRESNNLLSLPHF